MISFEEFFNSYYNKVYIYVKKRVVIKQVAEDITMDCFVSAYQNFGKYDESKANYQTWLFVIVNNRLKNYYRDNKNNELLDDNIYIDMDFTDEVLQAEYISELREFLYEALMALKEIERKVIIFKFFYEKNSSEISKIIGISPSNVRMILSRSLKKLKSELQKKDIELED